MDSAEELFAKYLPPISKPGSALSLGDAVISVNGQFSDGGQLLLALATHQDRSQTFLLTPFVVEKLATLLAQRRRV